MNHNKTLAIVLSVLLFLLCKDIINAYTIIFTKNAVLFSRVHLSKNKKYAVLVLEKNREVDRVYHDTFKLNGIDSSVAKYKRIIFFTLREDSTYNLYWSTKATQKYPPLDFYIFNNGKHVVAFGPSKIDKDNYLVIYDSTGEIYRKYDAGVCFPRRKHLFADTTIEPYRKSDDLSLQYTVNEDSMLLKYVVKVEISDVWKSKVIVDTFTLYLNTGELIRYR